MAAAVPRSLVGNHAAAILLLPGKAGDSDRPTKNLSIKSEVMMVAVSPKMSVKPIKTVNKDHKTGSRNIHGEHQTYRVASHLEFDQLHRPMQRPRKYIP